MRESSSKRSFVAIAVVALLLALAMPVTSFGQEQFRRQGRGRNFDNRKCGKFVNCHDARDGRWDNRGRRNAFRWSQRDNRWQDGRWRNIRLRDNRWQENRWRSIRLRDNRWQENRWRTNSWRNVGSWSRRSQPSQWRPIRWRDNRWRNN